MNNQNHILRALISESTPSGAGPGSSPYKFSVNSTIIQHMAQRNFNYQTASTSTSSPSASTSTSQDPTTPVSPATSSSAGVGSELTSGRASNENTGVGRRGMHSACGAYWNNEKDGMWSFKYETRGIPPQHCEKAAGSGGVGSASKNKVCSGLTGCCGKGLDVVISVIWIAV